MNNGFEYVLLANKPFTMAADQKAKVIALKQEAANVLKEKNKQAVAKLNAQVAAPDSQQEAAPEELFTEIATPSNNVNQVASPNPSEIAPEVVPEVAPEVTPENTVMGVTFEKAPSLDELNIAPQVKEKIPSSVEPIKLDEEPTIEYSNNSNDNFDNLRKVISEALNSSTLNEAYQQKVKLVLEEAINDQQLANQNQQILENITTLASSISSLAKANQQQQPAPTIDDGMARTLNKAA